MRAVLDRLRSLLRPGAPPPVRSAEAIRAYWRHPDPDNAPERYLGGASAARRSAWLVQRVAAFLPREASILELGCNVGRNLAGLHAAGYRHLHGVEINEGALALLRSHHPELAAGARLHAGAAEDVLLGLGDEAYDLVFSVAVLEHVHPDSEWLFPHLARITRHRLLTVEDEHGRSPRHFPRDYRRVFEPLGLEQLEHERLGPVRAGVPRSFHARLFGHRS